jgi:hypothetical protein
MPLSFRIFLEGVGDGDGSIAQVLSVHGFNSSIRRLKAGKVDEGITLRVACVWVSHDLGNRTCKNLLRNHKKIYRRKKKIKKGKKKK